MAEIEGFEPPHDGSKDHCLTAWRYLNLNYYNIILYLFHENQGLFYIFIVILLNMNKKKFFFILLYNNSRTLGEVNNIAYKNIFKKIKKNIQKYFDKEFDEECDRNVMYNMLIIISILIFIFFMVRNYINRKCKKNLDNKSIDYKQYSKIINFTNKEEIYQILSKTYSVRDINMQPDEKILIVIDGETLKYIFRNEFSYYLDLFKKYLYNGENVTILVNSFQEKNLNNLKYIKNISALNIKNKLKLIYSNTVPEEIQKKINNHFKNYKVFCNI
jgi:hypothetical protein